MAAELDGKNAASWRVVAELSLRMNDRLAFQPPPPAGAALSPALEPTAAAAVREVMSEASGPGAGAVAAAAAAASAAAAAAAATAAAGGLAVGPTEGSGAPMDRTQLAVVSERALKRLTALEPDDTEVRWR